MTLAAETRRSIERARGRYPSARSAVMPSLWAVQHELGMITSEAMAEVATLLGLGLSNVKFSAGGTDQRSMTVAVVERTETPT